MTITTECYGRIKKWESREEAIAYFTEGVYHSEGSEQMRYLRILEQLTNGKTTCTDEE